MHVIETIREEGREPTDKEIKEIRKTQRESTQYLTNGSQHALDMVNGHYLSVIGLPSAGIELLGQAWTLDELATALDALPSRRSR